MADFKISGLPPKTGALTGSELLEIALAGASYSVTAQQISIQWNPMTAVGDVVYMGSSGIARLPLGALGTVFVATSGGPAWLPMSGDASIDATGKVTVHSTNGSTFAPSAFTDTTNATNIVSGTLPAGVIPATGVASGTYGDATHVAQFTVGADGRVTAVTSVAIGGGVATVSSVGLVLPSDFLVTNSPVTTAGTLTAVRANQSPNTFLAGPTAIPVGAPAYRAIVVADLPTGIPVANISGLATVATVGNFASLSGTPTTLAGYGITDAAGLSAANSFTNQQAVAPYRASVSGAVSIDLAATAKSNVLILTLTGNITSFALTNPVDGAKYRIRFIQDATGSRTIAGINAAFKFAGGTAPVLSTAANAVDYLTADYGATENTYMCEFHAGMA